MARRSGSRAVTNGANDRALLAVTLAGSERIVARVPAHLQLEDIWQDGKALLSRQSARRELSGLISGMNKEQDFSWLDYSFPAELSTDGKRLAISMKRALGAAQAIPFTYARPPRSPRCVWVTGRR